MQIIFESELMKNQKHADVMAPDKRFEVLQDAEGDSLFFSIGTDGVLYLTREARETSTGWDKIDLSGALAAGHGGGPVAARAFDVSQNPATGKIDLALALAIGGADRLYLSLGNSNADLAWADGVKWTEIPCDAAGVQASNLTVADLSILQIPSSSGASRESFVVDILKEPGNSLALIERYYIVPGETPQWNAHPLPQNLSAGEVASVLGRRAKDRIAGIYTFGKIQNEQQLVFTPLYNVFDPGLVPNPARLSLPGGTTAFAAALDASGASNVFGAASGGLYLYAPDRQDDLANPVSILPDPLLAGVQALAAASTAGRTAVWGVNQQGDLFCVSCAAGKEADPTAWSKPLPILSDVEGIASFLNLKRDNSVIFAHTSGRSLVQLTQDPVTSEWRQRSILLPTTARDDMVEYNSFTTHLKVADDANVGQPNVKLEFTAASPVSAYLNDVYHVLSPDVPVRAQTDATGALTIVQETQALAAVVLHARLEGVPSSKVDVDPMSKALATIAGIESGDDLARARAPQPDGTTKKLLPDDVSGDDRDSAAQALKQFLGIAKDLPSDGSVKTGTAKTGTAGSRTGTAAAAAPPVWGVSFGGDGATYHEGHAAATRFGLALAPVQPNGPVHPHGFALAAGAPGASTLPDAIKVEAGDFFNWLKKAFHEVAHFFVQVAEDTCHFFVKIADTLYHVVLDCVSKVVHAIEFVFNKIKVFFEDLIQWLGFIFQWDDIVRTHKVMKNIYRLYAHKIVAALDTVEDDVKGMFVGLEDRINAWAGITDAPDTIGHHAAGSANLPGQNSPQANWALHHTKGNLLSADTPYDEDASGLGTIEKVLADLEKMVDDEVGSVKDAVDQIRTQVAEPFASLTASEVVKRLFAIVADLILKTAENLILTLIDVVKILLEGLIEMLDAPIDIPIVSKIYESISGGEKLSFLDLACLVAAIPATVVYKLVTKEAPYPDDAMTRSLIDAPDFATLERRLVGEAQGLLHAPAFAAREQRRPSLGDGTSAESRATADGEPLSDLDKANGSLQIGALLGAAGVAIIAFLKGRDPKEGGDAESGASETTPLKGGAKDVPSGALRLAAFAFTFPYIGPDIVGGFNKPKRWTTVMNDVVTGVWFLKTAADNLEWFAGKAAWSHRVSPIAECVLNVTWLAPAIGAIIETSDPKKADWLGMGANLAFDIGGALAPGADKELGGEAAPIVFGIAEVLTASYGILSTAAGSELLQHK